MVSKYDCYWKIDYSPFPILVEENGVKNLFNYFDDMINKTFKVIEFNSKYKPRKKLDKSQVKLGDLVYPNENATQKVKVLKYKDVKENFYYLLDENTFSDLEEFWVD